MAEHSFNLHFFCCEVKHLLAHSAVTWRSFSMSRVSMCFAHFPIDFWGLFIKVGILSVDLQRALKILDPVHYCFYFACLSWKSSKFICSKIFGYFFFGFWISVQRKIYPLQSCKGFPSFFHLSVFMFPFRVFFWCLITSISFIENLIFFSLVYNITVILKISSCMWIYF